MRYGEQLSKDVLWDALVATAKKRETLEQIETEDIVLDCNLPDGTGFSFCVIICYQIFLASAAASVGAKRTSTGCPAPLYLPLSEFVNTGGTIHAETEFDNIYYISILRRMYGR